METKITESKPNKMINIEKEKKGLMKDLTIMAIGFVLMLAILIGATGGLTASNVGIAFMLGALLYVPLQAIHIMHARVGMSIVIIVLYWLALVYLSEKFAPILAIFLILPMALIGKHIYRIRQGRKQ